MDRLRPLWEQVEVRGDPREREENPKRRLSRRSRSEEGRKPGEPVSLEPGKEGTQKGRREPPALAHLTVNTGHRRMSSKMPRRSISQVSMLGRPLGKQAGFSHKSKVWGMGERL